jgi:transmembrane sensor
MQKEFQKEFIDMLDRYLEGEATPLEQELVDDWYAAIHKQAGSPIQDENHIVMDRIARIMELVEKTEKGGAKVVLGKTNFWLWAAAAAVLAIAVSSIFLFKLRAVEAPSMSQAYDQQAKWKNVENSSSTSQVINLRDGSRITLKSGSRLKFPDPFHSAYREVYLDGEAFFEVARDPARPFMVYANEVVTQVLGTSFTVSTFQPNKVTVAVKTGSVSVYKQSEKSNAEKQVILTPNQKVVYDKSADQAVRMLVAEPKVIVPLEELTKMRFEEAPVAEIFQAIEKAYGVDILFDEQLLSGCSLTTFLVDETLYARLDIVCKTIGATYKVNADMQIVIESTGCQ